MFRYRLYRTPRNASTQPETKINQLAVSSLLRSAQKKQKKNIYMKSIATIVAYILHLHLLPMIDCLLI